MKRTVQHILISNGLIMMLLLMTVTLGFNSCQEPEPFSNTPAISFKDLRFISTSENNTLDSLVLEFDFEDGDGDLGLNESSPPYHDVDYIIDSNNNPVTISGNHPTPFYRFTPVDGGTLISSPNNNFGFIELFSDTDIRPSYSCLDYDTLSYYSLRRDTMVSVSPDTLFVVRNEFRFNLYLKFFWDFGEGFEELDFQFLTSPFGCGENFNGRFPIWDADNIGTSLQGTIKYSMVSAGFESTLGRGRRFKIQFYIYDRAGNQSNIIETPTYLLEDITFVQ